MLVDSHCHLDRLDLEKLGGDMDAVMAQAQAQGVERMLCVAINLAQWDGMMAIVRRYPNVYASVGVHPNEGEKEPSLDDLLQRAEDPDVIAIGETGLDYFRSEGDLTWQRDRFRRHIEAAKVCRKPLIIHSREAQPDTLDIMAAEGADTVGGVMHCFVDDWESARRSIDLNFYISFSGIVTFRNAQQLQEVARQVPLDRILVETDSPYLTPVPHRGKTNQPGYTRHVADFIAELKGVTPQEVARVTSENFFNLFPAAKRSTRQSAHRPVALPQ